MNKENNIEKRLKELWNKYAPYYKGTLLTPYVQRMGKMLLKSIVPCPGGIVHDGGCGTGFWISPILKITQAKKIIGTDFSEEMLNRAKLTLEKSKKIDNDQFELHLMDLTKEWPKEKFDAQLFHLFLYYLPYHEWKNIIKKAFDSTNPGGHIYSTVLLKGFSIKKASKKYIAKELFSMPLNALPFLVKATNIIKKIDEFVENKIIEYPSREEFIKYHEQVGFRDIEVVGEFLEGWGIIVKAKKS